MNNVLFFILLLFTIIKMELKTLEERREELNNIMRQIDMLGIPHDLISRFIPIANSFVQEGASASGIFNLFGLKRKMAYKLTNNKAIVSEVVFLYDKNV
jgi:hypothetical protein